MVRDLSNLWFLWQLLLLCGLLLIAARLGLRFRHPLWWLLIPASWLPMALMDQTFLVFGPQTSVAVAVEAPVPGFYATFFFFGVFFFQRGFEVRRRWMLAILPAVTLIYPLATGLLFVPARIREASQLQASLLETTFAWLMCFGMMGLFHAIALRERPWLRLLADSAFWIYLMHELLMELLSGAIWARVNNPHLHYLLLVLIVTGILLVAWSREVRYTWFGTLLNGKREWPGAESSLASYSPAAQGGR